MAAAQHEGAQEPSSLAAVAVVSGANRGLGLELCRQLLHRGWPVVALCRRTSAELSALAGDDLTQALAAVNGSSSTATAGPSGPTTTSVGAGSGSGSRSWRLSVVEGVDVADDACMEVIRQALAGIQVGLLVCNAGVLSVDSMADMDTATIRQQFEVNALGPLRVVHAVLPNLVSAPTSAAAEEKAGETAAAAAELAAGAAPAAAPSTATAATTPQQGASSGSAGGSGSGNGAKASCGQGSGSTDVTAGGTGGAAKVAIISSKMGSIEMTRQGGKNGSVGYRMSKVAANMGAQLLAMELAPSGIPVVAIHPGAIATDMYRSYWAAVGGPLGAGGMAPSAHGPVSVEAAAAGVLARVDELDLKRTGRFVQASNGEELPW